MRWIEGKNEYQKIRGMARWCVDVDSGRLPIKLTKLYFSDIMPMTPVFMPLLNSLIINAEEMFCIYMVLDPDPEYFWYNRLGIYPAFEYSHKDSTDEYLGFLNHPFSGNQGDNMISMWYSYAIVSPSQKWFVYTIRSVRDDSGHLWIPSTWKKKLLQRYEFLSDHMKSNPDEIREEIIVAARKIIHDDAQIVTECRRIVDLYHSLDGYHENIFKPILKFVDEIQTLPIGEARKLYTEEYLVREDCKLEKIMKHEINNIKESAKKIIDVW